MLTDRFAPKRFLTYFFISMAGLFVMYLSGNLYFYFVSNYIAHITVSWKIVLINCFLLTVAGDFVLCVLSAIAAQRLTIIMRKILH